MKKHLCGLLVLGVALTLPCRAALKVYYLRHAESGSNAKKAWEDVPADRRPAWVGNADAFSDTGEKQAARVPEQLAGYRFDFIAVSPKWRTRHTILPYLRANGLKAEVWPELLEFGGGDGDLALIGSSKLPPPSPDLFTGGEPIDLPAEEQRYLTFGKAGRNLPKLGAGGAQGAADLTFMLRRLIDRVRADFGGTDQAILLVGHGNAGQHLLELLTGEREILRGGLRNVGLWLAEEQADGSFKIVMANSQPVTPAASANKR